MDTLNSVDIIPGGGVAAGEGGLGLWPSGRAGGGCCSSLLGKSVTLILSLMFN